MTVLNHLLCYGFLKKVKYHKDIKTGIVVFCLNAKIF